MNPVTHFEIPYRDSQRASKFYRTVFEWELQDLGPDMNNYTLATTATSDVKIGGPAGAINGGLYAYDADRPGQHPSLVIGVGNIGKAMDLINQNGGEIIGDLHEIPGFGKYVSFRDSEGNRLSIIEPKI